MASTVQSQYAVVPHFKDRKLVDIRSCTVSAVREIFEALDIVGNLHVTLSKNPDSHKAHSLLEVALPRFDLNFFLNDGGRFECRELSRIIDPNQSVGTMIGLRNRLILCGTRSLAMKHDRIMLIPEGTVTVVSRKSHSTVTIESSDSTVRAFRYQIDATLRRVHEDRDIYTTLYKVYLHALTSHVLPDLLLERTGTEEAINYLQQRSLTLTDPPDTKLIDLLTKISALTPPRSFTNNKQRLMQTVQWNPDLSMLAQHDAFLPLAQAIIKSGDPYVVFHSSLKRAPDLYKANDDKLLTRARIRNSCHRGTDFGEVLDARSHEVLYEGRDSYETPERGERSFQMASLVKSWPQRSEVSTSIWQDLSSIGEISKLHATFDASASLTALLESTLASSFGPLLNLCRGSTQDEDTYLSLFLFAALAYGRPGESLMILQTILSFAFVSDLRTVKMPIDHAMFTPDRGCELNEMALEKLIRDNMKACSTRGKRSDPDGWEKGYLRHQIECDEQTKELVQQYKSQWPTSSPSDPAKALSNHIRWGIASEQVSELFLTWTANRTFERYFTAVQRILDAVNTRSDATEYLPNYWHSREATPDVQNAGALPPSMRELLVRDAPRPSPQPAILKLARPRKEAKVNNELHAIISDLSTAVDRNHPGTTRSTYRDDLLNSYDVFRSYQEPTVPEILPCDLNEVRLNRMSCECEVSTALDRIHGVVGPENDKISQLLESGGLWPRRTIRSLLALLSTTSSNFMTGQ